MLYVVFLLRKKKEKTGVIFELYMSFHKICKKKKIYIFIFCKKYKTQEIKAVAVIEVQSQENDKVRYRNYKVF